MKRKLLLFGGIFFLLTLVASPLMAGCAKPSPAPTPAPQQTPETSSEEDMKPPREQITSPEKSIGIEALELQVFELINRERLNDPRDRETIDWSEDWHEEARAASEYAAETGDLNPYRWSFYGAMFKGTGYGLDEVAVIAVDTWMQDPEARGELLNDEVCDGAVGIAISDDGTVYITYLARD